MPTTSAIANALRAFASHLDKSPDVEIAQPTLSFYHGSYGSKEEFLALARIFPRPYDKGDGWSHDQLTLTHKSDALEVFATIDRNKVCTLIEPARPAVYRCEPLLSSEEESIIAKEAL